MVSGLQVVAQGFPRVVGFPKCSEKPLMMSFPRCLQSGQVEVSARSVHRLLLVATLLSAKLVDDRVYDNMYFAKVRRMFMT